MTASGFRQISDLPGKNRTTNPLIILTDIKSEENETGNIDSL